MHKQTVGGGSARTLCGGNTPPYCQGNGVRDKCVRPPKCLKHKPLVIPPKRGELTHSGQPFTRSGKVITCRFILGLEGNLYVLEQTDAWRLRCSLLSGELRVLVRTALGCRCALGWVGSGGSERAPASGSWPPRDPISVLVVFSARGAEGGAQGRASHRHSELPSPPPTGSLS